jgi:hypothetical protein
MSDLSTTPATLEVTNLVGMKLHVAVASVDDAYAKMRALGARGFSTGEQPAGGYSLPYRMADTFDFSLIGGRYFEHEKDGVKFKCVDHRGQLYTRRDYEAETRGQRKPAKIKFSRGAKPTDPPHLKEGDENSPQYVTLISFVGNGFPIEELEKPKGGRNGSTRTAPPAAAASTATQPAAAASAPADAAPTPAPTPAVRPAAAPTVDAPAARPLSALPPRVDLIDRWAAIGRKKEDIPAWLTSLGVVKEADGSFSDAAKAAIHAALLQLEERAPSVLDRWKALGEEPKEFVKWVKSLGVAVPEKGGMWEPSARAKIHAALADLEAQKAELAEYEAAAQ